MADKAKGAGEKAYEGLGDRPVGSATASGPGSQTPGGPGGTGGAGLAQRKFEARSARGSYYIVAAGALGLVAIYAYYSRFSDLPHSPDKKPSVTPGIQKPVKE